MVEKAFVQECLFFQVVFICLGPAANTSHRIGRRSGPPPAPSAVNIPPPISLTRDPQRAPPVLPHNTAQKICRFQTNLLVRFWRVIERFACSSNSRIASKPSAHRPSNPIHTPPPAAGQWWASQQSQTSEPPESCSATHSAHAQLRKDLKES